MIETVIAIAGFAISVGGLVSEFTLVGYRKVFVSSVVIAALAASSGIALYQHYSSERLVQQVQTEIIEVLSVDTMTFDELFQRLPYRSLPVVNEALLRSVEIGTVGHRLLELQGNTKIISVRAYYLK